MEFRSKWLGYDRDEVNRLIKQTADANNAATENTRELLETLNSENEQLEAELRHLQGRIEKSAARAVRLEDSSYLVDMFFTITRDALVFQRGEILQIATQMADELSQRCNELKSEADNIDATIGIMQKQIEEKLAAYQRILHGNSQEMARISGKYPLIVQAHNALNGEIQAGEAVIPPQEADKPNLQLVKNENDTASDARIANQYRQAGDEKVVGIAATAAAADESPANPEPQANTEAAEVEGIETVSIGEDAADNIPAAAIVNAAVQAAASADAAPDLPPLSFADGSWHALIIDDDSTVLAMLRAIFEREGAYVTEAADGNVAAALINEMAPPDVVILDLMLPYVDGFQLLLRMRNKPGWNLVPVVILSSRTSEQEAVKLLQAGASDYVTKPFNTRELMTRAKMAMHRDPLALQA